jgi:murein DD-endopeptidase MepM/ murein hydrolase activator NlpD
MLNSDKAWYTADARCGPYNGHPTRARDWNLESGGDTDLDEPLVAPAPGSVVYAGNAGEGHGLVVVFVGSVDGLLVNWHWKHLNRLDVRAWQWLEEGDPLGTIGNAGGKYAAHLHEEVLLGAITGPTHSWNDCDYDYVDPAAFYAAHGADVALIERLTKYDRR